MQCSVRVCSRIRPLYTNPCSFAWKFFLRTLQEKKFLCKNSPLVPDKQFCLSLRFLQDIWSQSSKVIPRHCAAWSLTQRCLYNLEVWLSGVFITSKSDSAVSFNLEVWLSGVLTTSKSDSAVSLQPRNRTKWCPLSRPPCFSKIKYLGEIQVVFENILSCLSGVQMGLMDDKNGGEDLVHHICTVWY